MMCLLFFRQSNADSTCLYFISGYGEFTGGRSEITKLSTSTLSFNFTVSSYLIEASHNPSDSQALIRVLSLGDNNNIEI